MASSKIFLGIKSLLLLVIFVAIMNLSIADQTYCGEHLDDVLDMMCPNGFNKYKTKRSSLSLDEDLGIDTTDEDFNFGMGLDMWPFLTSLDNSGIAKLRRRRFGVAHECCNKPCSTNELKTYCNQ